MAKAIKDWILEMVEDYTEAEPDGIQNVQSNVWTSVRLLTQKASGSSTPYTPDNVETAIYKLVDEGELVVWNGLLAPGTKSHVRSIIENEVEAGITRTILVGKLNRHLQEIDDTESESRESSDSEEADTDEESSGSEEKSG